MQPLDDQTMEGKGKADKGDDIPEHLIDKLSANLFGANSGHQEVALTPSEAALNTLIDAAGSTELSLPGGGKLTFNRKDLQRLKKQADNDVP